MCVSSRPLSKIILRCTVNRT